MTIKDVAKALATGERNALYLLTKAGISGRKLEVEGKRKRGGQPLDYDDAKVMKLAEERRAKLLAKLPPG